MTTIRRYDIIVIGGGHAGCEAAAASAKMGLHTLLITSDMSRIAALSCNPAMGGIAKGQIVREIDALGGMTGILSDKATLQFRMLNRSKGPAMWSPRAQLDKDYFSILWRNELTHTDSLEIIQDTVRNLIIQNKRVKGVVTDLWGEIQASRIILSAGTFLRGIMHFGAEQFPGGRIGEPPVNALTEQLSDCGIATDRMKTGTPPRINIRTVDLSLAEIQHGDSEARGFSFMHTASVFPQQPCYVLHTNAACHAILQQAIDEGLSPLYNGQIHSIGPRYCPSIETKIVTFAGRDHHQLFLEPEGHESNEYYLNGFSSSLPPEVQLAALRTIPAFQNVRFFKPGYAIEYDFFDPTQLKPTMESLLIDGLYMAGQVNGTTGYEEAACQGLMAGINAALSLLYTDKELILKRNEAYIGVLIDDLVTKGVDEPYRMFTSRAEFRILLRQDNADSRLTPTGHSVGLVNSARYEAFCRKEEQIKSLIQYITSLSVTPEEMNHLLRTVEDSELRQGVKLRELLLRPKLSLEDLSSALPSLREKMEEANSVAPEVSESAEIAIKYQGYIEREQMEAERLLRMENLRLGDRLDYASIESLSTEARQKLQRIKPLSLAQAARIPGVSPHDISVLLVLLKQ